MDGLLLPEYQQILAGRETEEKRLLREQMEAITRGYGARGVTGRAKQEQIRKAIEGMTGRLGELRGGLFGRQVGRRQALEDIAGERRNNR